jgi:hypothetical protein
MEYGAHRAKGRGPTRGDGVPQQYALGKQPQKQPEEAEDEHGKVPDASPVIRGVLVRAAHRPGRGLVLRVADALWRVAERVQGPEGPMAQQQRADEQHGELPGARRLHRWSGPALLVTGDAIVPFGRGDRSSTLSKETLLFASRTVAPTDVRSQCRELCGGRRSFT